MATYHLVPLNYTGLANKNTGNVKGDIEYALSTLHTCTSAPNRRCMDQQIIETVKVNVYGNYSEYKQCNMDPADFRYVCCDGKGKKGEPPCSATASCLVGRELKKKFAGGGEGYWYSWPQCGEGVSWSVAEPPTRINASCVGNGWRKLAGGCPECGPALDECISWCIGNSTDATIDKLENVWFSIVQDNPDACPPIPLPPRTPSPPTPPTPTPPRPTPPTPTPTPAPALWACGGNGTCIMACIGHHSKVKCQDTCTPPASGMRYTCGGFGQCYQKKEGDHKTVQGCTNTCGTTPCPAPPSATNW